MEELESILKKFRERGELPEGIKMNPKFNDKTELDSYRMYNNSTFSYVREQFDSYWQYLAPRMKFRIRIHHCIEPLAVSIEGYGGVTECFFIKINTFGELRLLLTVAGLGDFVAKNL